VPTSRSTSFWARWPMNSDSPDQKKAEGPRVETASARLPPKVFVVDDEEFIRELYRDVFEAKGMTVSAAPNGEEAVRILGTIKNRPDVIIMDHRMPGKDGIQTTEEIMRIDPSIPIIFSSADVAVRERALEAGAVSFWAKPFPVSMLVDAMLDIVEARRRLHPK
jgi:CheY-like chemotaxis protein